MSEQNQLRFPVGAIVTPGDRLGSLRVLSPGIGTYARGGHVFASSVGTLQRKDDDCVNGLAEVSVVSSKAPPATSQVLVKGQLVLCRVTKVMLQQVAVEIIAAAANCPLLLHNKRNDQPDATIRREDVRHGTSSAEELHLELCFRPGDWVLGRIVSLGDARRYLVSTAEPELGVVRATSLSSTDGQYHVMQPISLKEMKCPVTGRKEARKVAKASHDMLKQVLLGTTSNTK